MENIDIAVDSGAVDHVGPTSLGQGIATKETAASRRGAKYRVANGEAIFNYGEKTIHGVNQEGEPIGLTVQITDVTKPLCAVGRITDAGNRVMLDKTGGYIENIKTGVRTGIERRNGTYKLDIWRKLGSEKEEEILTRQGK